MSRWPLVSSHVSSREKEIVLNYRIWVHVFIAEDWVLLTCSKVNVTIGACYFTQTNKHKQLSVFTHSSCKLACLPHFSPELKHHSIVTAEVAAFQQLD